MGTTHRRQAVLFVVATVGASLVACATIGVTALACLFSGLEGEVGVNGAFVAYVSGLLLLLGLTVALLTVSMGPRRSPASRLGLRAGAGAGSLLAVALVLREVDVEALTAWAPGWAATASLVAYLCGTGGLLAISVGDIVRGRDAETTTAPGS